MKDDKENRKQNTNGKRRKNNNRKWEEEGTGEVNGKGKRKIRERETEYLAGKKRVRARRNMEKK